MTDLLRLAALLLWIALGLNIGLQGASNVRRGATQIFLAYTVLLHALIGMSQLDAWPFSTYRLANASWNGNGMRINSRVIFVGVDAGGREWPIDPLAWSPLFPVVLQFYFRDVYPTLSPAQQRRAAAFFYARAESARASLRRSRWIGNQKLLGPLAAPDWSLYKRHRDVPSTQWSCLRVYRELWRPEERLRDRSRVTLVLVLEHRPR